MGHLIEEHRLTWRGEDIAVRITRRDVAVLGFENLDLDSKVAKLVLEGVVACFFGSAGHLRDDDGRQDSEDHHHDQNFDKRETARTDAVVGAQSPDLESIPAHLDHFALLESDRKQGDFSFTQPQVQVSWSD